MRHDIQDILRVIDAMHDKALLYMRMQDCVGQTDNDRIVMKNTLDDIQTLARKITNETDSN